MSHTIQRTNHPHIFPTTDVTQLQEILDKYHPTQIDEYYRQLSELHQILHPQELSDPTPKKIQALKQRVGDGNWVYFPWNNTLCHLLPENELFILKTARNKHLITDTEQKKLANTNVLVVGLSVGSHAALTWMLQSHAKNIIVADFDELDGSNLNRIRSGWQNLGKMKLTLVSQSLYEQNPYCQITCVPGISINESKALLHQTPPIDAIIDSLDNLDIKLELRQLARQLKIPLIMATDIDTTIKIDIERHDVCHTPFFNGSIPEDEITTINSLNETQRRKLAIKLVGLENNSLAMMHSLKEIKKSIPTWPQLGATATMAGGIITTIITKIIQKKSVKSGTYWVNLDSIFESDYELKTTERQKTRQALERHLKLN